jgi:hypothetical protein
MASPFPRYTTFGPEERERLGLLGTAAGSTPTPHQRPGAPIKAHRFAVTYPDGTQGECRYERLGPAWHRFRFFDRDHQELPRQYLSERLPSGAHPLSRPPART